jgi:deoxyadenosine/deoxycytidine kinase
MLIIVEGNIGAGKSSITKAIAEKIKAYAMYEPVESNPYLEDFYKDQKRWALEMQYWLMAKRYKMHEEAIEHIMKTGQAVIMDRSIYGDAVFAKKNWMDNNIDDRGFKAYMQHRNLYVNRLLTPNITIYLDVLPETCHHRILNLRKRDAESAIPIAYLQGLDKCYHELLMELEERGSDVYRIPWEEFGKVDEVLKTISASERFKVFWQGYKNV